MNDVLESIWSSNRECIRRLLMGMTHDSDLVEDLLQETYLRAWRGMSGYRGGDARAWLSVIARNVFYSYIRQTRVKMEVQAESDLCFRDIERVGSRDHVEELDIKTVLSKLPDDLRTALVMKHHMGMTYREIARRTDCAAVTARARVHRAVSFIRNMLDERWMPTEPACLGMSTRRILDYLYCLLRPESMEAVEQHIHGCSLCRERVADIHALMRAVDASVSDSTMMHLLDVDDWGMPSLHVTMGSRNESGQPVDTLSFGARSDHGLQALAVPGARLGYDAGPHENAPGLLQYTADLPDIVPPGQELRTMLVFGQLPDRRARRTENGTYRLDWDQKPSDAEQFAYTQVIRLPKGSRVVSANPSPADIITNGHVTLIWRTSLQPAERFLSTVEYRIAG